MIDRCVANSSASGATSGSHQSNIHDDIDVSFIIPCFNEAGNIDAFFDEFRKTFSKTDYRCELIFVDDGSTDETFSKIERLASSTQDEKTKIIGLQLSRNFGKESGIWSGLNEAQGSYIGIIDADLQQSPEDALSMLNTLSSDPEIDCVAAFQEKRNERGVLKGLKKGFYGIFSKATGMSAIRDASDFRIFNRKVAQALLDMPERNRFSKGMFAWVGFKTLPYGYNPEERRAGESKWSGRKLVSYAMEGILSFTTAPLRIATFLGLFAAACAVIYTIIIILDVMIRGIDVPGYATLMIVVLMLGGGPAFLHRHTRRIHSANIPRRQKEAHKHSAKQGVNVGRQGALLESH